jgi:hypothetical protein
VSRRKQRKAIERWTEEMREFSMRDACQLAIDLGVGVPVSCPVTDLGVVLTAGEIVWRETVLRYATLSTTTHTEWREGFGGPARSYTVEQRAWRDWGQAPWRATSHRVVGRLPGGELIGLWWGRITGCIVDLGTEQVILDGPDSWRYAFSGPGVPVIAVAAVAHLHGVQALVTHPALARLRSDDPLSRPVDSSQPALCEPSPRDL